MLEQHHQLPHSIEAERAVLGAIMRSPSNINLVIDQTSLSPEHFYIDAHKKVFSAILELESKGMPVDLITVMEHLEKSKSGLDITNHYLLELSAAGPVAQNVSYYAKIIKEKHVLRKIILTSQDSIKAALSGHEDVSTILEVMEKEFLTFTADKENGEGLESAKKILIPTLEEIERRIQSDGKPTGVPSGFTDLDKITGGWQKSDLIILAARPGMGKTALALNWALNCIKNSTTAKVAIFTLEMSKTQIMERLLSAQGQVDSTKLRKGTLTDKDQDQLMNAARFMNSRGEQIMIDDTPSISITELRARCRRYQREHGLDFVIIDYLQLMSGSLVSQKQGREREISEISMRLKALAKELHVPIVAAAQLNRGPDARPDKKPRVSDLRESGSMEQDADQILFVYRDEYYNPASEHAGKAELILAKNRHGETGSIYLAWLPNFVTFHNLSIED